MLNAAIGTARDIGTIEGSDIYDYDFKEDTWYTFRLTGFHSIIEPNGKVLAFCYKMDQTKKLFVLDLFRGLYLRFNLSAKTHTNIMYEWLGQKLTDDVFSLESYRPIANCTVAEAIDNINSSLGDIDTALDELHTYAQGLVLGGASE